jgi:hypothetical protein
LDPEFELAIMDGKVGWKSYNWYDKIQMSRIFIHLNLQHWNAKFIESALDLNRSKSEPKKHGTKDEKSTKTTHQDGIKTNNYIKHHKHHTKTESKQINTNTIRSKFVVKIILFFKKKSKCWAKYPCAQLV